MIGLLWVLSLLVPSPGTNDLGTVLIGPGRAFVGRYTLGPMIG